MADKLAVYRAKRDFKTTAEPSGEVAVNPADRLRFVIQKHDATRLHYDLRLELDGVFKSWAVTRGPSLDPVDKRLAVEVEDHPLDYGDFEGVIPAGEYGGGTVMLWDRGYWSPDAGQEPHEAYANGDLKVVFEGERLHGSWVLVRMKHDRDGRKGGGGRSNWLLIKHRDAGAQPGDHDALLQTNTTSIASGRDMAQIAAGLGKGPTRFMTATPDGAPKRAAAKRVWNSRKGDPEASAEAVAQDAPQAPAPKVKKARAKAAAPLPDFVPPQLAQTVARPPQGENWAHEIKFDGYRLQLRTENGRATVRTRRGLDWTDRFPEIAAAAATLPDGLVDGEAVALDAHGAPDFAGLQQALSDGQTAGLVFFAFDLLFAGREDLRGAALETRKSRLERHLAALDAAAAERLRFVDHFRTGGDAVLESACAMHLEGIVSKRLDAPYVSGRSESWAKSKCRGGQEVVIAGWTSEPAKPFRSLIAAVQRDGRLVHVGRIGTGFSEAKVATLFPRLQALETELSPFGKDGPKRTPGVHWVRPELVAEIQSAGWTGGGALRQASFKALREDKPATEVVREDPVAVEPTPSPARSSSTTRGPVVMGVAISNPDKILWPAHDAAPAESKLDLARFYEAVGPAMLDHIAGRPCSVIRQPDGLGGQSFFQRHAMAGASSLLTLVEVRGDKKPYLQIDRIEALIAVAQTGGVELHPWNCAPNRPDVAGRLVFDLDPSEGLGFDAVIDAAHEVRARLAAVGLEAFCKTTGGKGLHVVTPLVTSDDAGVDWPRAKAFAKGLCEQMAADAPTRYLVNMAKAQRKGRIFLDYLRNDRLSTAVAPYSPRGRPGAPVSWPLTWDEVRKGLDPMAYRIDSVPKLLAKSKAWADYVEAARALEPAIARLAGPRA